jgi:hypothetical protein
MNSPYRKPRAYAPDPDAPGHACDAPDCLAAGEYRAPKSRTNLREFHWFCLPHVREYNASWDYYQGMSPGEIEAQLRSDTSWQRPSWPLGRLGATARLEQTLEDSLHFTFGSKTASPPKPKAPAELREALEVLGLAWPVSMATVKSTYKKLAKRHHPDANGGNKASEEILKTINLAYAQLRGKLAEALARAPQPAAE